MKTEIGLIPFVILNGPNLGGKDAVKIWLEKTYGFKFISTGERYRQMGNHPVNGPIILRTQETGDLVPDEIHIPIFNKTWPEFISSNWGSLLGLNGAIRTVGQAEAFVPLIHLIRGRYDPLQLVIEPNEDELRRRRSVAAQDPERGIRNDDTPEAFDHRYLKVYKQQIVPGINRTEDLGIRTVRIVPGYNRPKVEVRQQVATAIGLPFDV